MPSWISISYLPSIVIREGGRITIAETDDHGTVAELQPEVDMLLVQELIAEAAKVLG